VPKKKSSKKTSSRRRRNCNNNNEPNWVPSPQLIDAVSRLNLPKVSTDKLLKLVRDPPPPHDCSNVVDALVSEVLPRSLYNEGLTQKHQRISLYCLVYFPFQWLPDHVYMSFVDDATYSEDHDHVKDFRRNQGKKTKASLKKLGFRCVALIRSKKSEKETDVVGFRLTASADDYHQHVIKRAEIKGGKALKNFGDTVSDEQILVSDIRDPLVKKEVSQAKTTAKEISDNRKLDVLMLAPAEAEKERKE